MKQSFSKMEIEIDTYLYIYTRISLKNTDLYKDG